MQITRKDLTKAVEKNIISSKQAEEIWQSLEESQKNKPQLNIIYFAYYLGTFIVMAALGWLMTDTWKQVGGLGLSTLGSIYATIFVSLAFYLQKVKSLHLASGIFTTLAVWMTPLIVFGLQNHWGLWTGDDPGVYSGYFQWIKGGWFAMEVATIITSLIALLIVRFPFLLFPLCFTLWFMSMDVVPLIYTGTDTQYARKVTSIIFGTMMVGVSFIFDKRLNKDYSFWGYIFGAICFWSGLTLLNSDSELGKLIYFLINIIMMMGSIFIQRKVFMVLGSIGFFIYLGHLAAKVFHDSFLFPIFLTAMGCLLIYGGVIYQKNQAKIESILLKFTPAFLKKYLPLERNVKK